MALLLRDLQDAAHDGGEHLAEDVLEHVELPGLLLLDLLPVRLAEDGRRRPAQVVDLRADEAVPALEVVVEEAEGPLGGDGGEPEAELGELHGEGVLVDAIDAALDDAALPVRKVLLDGLGLHVRIGGEGAGEVLGGLDQEVTAAHGGVEDLVHQPLAPASLTLSLAKVGYLRQVVLDALGGLLDKGADGVFDDVLDDVLGRVVGARGLALAAIGDQVDLAGGAAVDDAEVFKVVRYLRGAEPLIPHGRHGLVGDARLILEEPLVDGARMADAEGAVVDKLAARPGGAAAEEVEGADQGPIANLVLFEKRVVGGVEGAAVVAGHP